MCSTFMWNVFHFYVESLPLVFELFNVVESAPLVLESAPLLCVCVCFELFNVVESAPL
jgi:hypothetical protein